MGVAQTVAILKVLLSIPWNIGNWQTSFSMVAIIVQLLAATS
jgi:hypothetical protein